MTNIHHLPSVIQSARVYTRWICERLYSPEVCHFQSHLHPCYLMARLKSTVEMSPSAHQGNCRSISGVRLSSSSCNSPQRGSGSPSVLGMTVIFRSERLRGTIDCPDDRCYVSHGLNCFLLQQSVCVFGVGRLSWEHCSDVSYSSVMQSSCVYWNELQFTDV